MNTANTKRHTQARGRGRPALEAGVDTVPVTIRMTSKQKEKLARLGGALGGAHWIRERIDGAKEPQK